MKKILIVEDDLKISKVLQYALGEEGFEVLHAEDGPTGLSMARAQGPDIVLLDCMLPGMEGVEVCRALKSDGAHSSIPIIMLTALGDKENVVRGLSAGANDYVTKPFEFEELLARLRSHLRMKELFDTTKQAEKEKTVLLDISHSLSATLDPHDTLYTIVTKIAEVIEVKRCSVIYIDAANQKGYVMSSHDSEKIRKLAIDLRKYPEIQKVMETGEAVVIDDVYNDPLLFGVRDLLSMIDVKSIMAFPILFKSALIGTLILRTSRREAPFSGREKKFCQVLSHLAASPLKNAYLFEILHLERDKERQARLAAEESIKEQNERLLLLNEDLRAARERAEEANRLKTEFLANISHELRTPLTSIIGFSRLIEQNKEISENVKEFSEIIHYQGNKLLELINDLLDLSKLEMGAISFKYITVNVNRLMREALLSQLEEIEKRRHRVVEQFEADLPDSWLDWEKGVRIFVNLINNAAKFTPDGGEITLTTRRNGDYVEGIVRDNGMGIRKEDLDVIFDRFRQLDGASTRRHNGVGLGLDLVRRLVKEMGGKIRVESEPGQGSSFMVTFQIKTNPTAEDAKSAENAKKA